MAVIYRYFKIMIIIIINIRMWGLHRVFNVVCLLV